MNLSLIIVSCNYDGLLELLVSISEPIDIYIVDDGLARQPYFGAGRIRYVAALRDQAGPFNLSRNRNLGMDLALKDSPGHDIIFLDDDTRVIASGFFSDLNALLHSDESYGLISSSFVFKLDKKIKTGQAGVHESKNIVGACSMIKNKLSHLRFDERYTGYGQEDIDFCMQVRTLGYKTVKANGIFLYHANRGGFKDKTVTENNQKLLESKWGDKLK